MTQYWLFLPRKKVYIRKMNLLFYILLAVRLDLYFYNNQHSAIIH
jgi:hypothetical protein